jgi:hypothetical protein
METITSTAQGQPPSSIQHDLEDRKDELARAIRLYQSARLTNAGSIGSGKAVEAAEDVLIEAWRTVIDLEGQLIGYRPLPSHAS